MSRLALVAVIALASVAQAGSISTSGPLTDDASTGISSSKTYTHAISGGKAVTVNGVSFATLRPDTTPANFSWNTNGASKNEVVNNNGDWNPAAGGVTGAGLIDLLGSFTYSGSGDAYPSSQTFTLTGLTPGNKYNTRMYIRTWDTEGSGRPINLYFTNGGDANGIGNLQEDRPSQFVANDQGAYYVNYEYTALSTELKIDATVSEAGGAGSGSYHLYGLTNELVPEPSAISLAGLAVLGLFSQRRRVRA